MTAPGGGSDKEQPNTGDQGPSEGTYEAPPIEQQPRWSGYETPPIQPEPPSWQPSYSPSDYGQQPPQPYPGYQYGGVQPGGVQPGGDQYNAPYPPPPPQGASYPGWYGAPDPGTNTLAIGSLVASVVGLLCGIGAIVGIVLGVIALNQIKQTRQGGYGLAVAGIVVGIGTLLLSVIFAMYAWR